MRRKAKRKFKELAAPPEPTAVRQCVFKNNIQGCSPMG